MDFEVQMQDQQFVSQVLGVWEREMEAFLAGRDEAGAVGHLAPIRDMVRMSDAQMYMNLARRVRHRTR